MQIILNNREKVYHSERASLLIKTFSHSCIVLVVQSCKLEVLNNLSIGEVLLVFSVLHRQADEVPVREHSHAKETTSEIAAQDKDGKDR